MNSVKPRPDKSTKGCLGSGLKTPVLKKASSSGAYTVISPRKGPFLLTFLTTLKDSNLSNGIACAENTRKGINPKANIRVNRRTTCFAAIFY